MDGWIMAAMTVMITDAIHQKPVNVQAHDDKDQQPSSNF